MTIEADFQRQALIRRLRPQPEWTQDGLDIGYGTRLVSFGAACDEDRLLTILSIASGRSIDRRVLKHIDAARINWMRGDKALAHIQLAFAQMPSLDAAGAYRAFLADRLMASGMTPAALRKALEATDTPAAQKYDSAQPRVPAGSGRTSGRWTSEDGTAAVREGRSAASSLRAEPAFYDGRGSDAEDRAREKERRVFGGGTSEDALHGRPLPLLPETAPVVPFPFVDPGPTGGGKGPSSSDGPHDDRSRLCPTPTKDWGVNDREFSARYQE